MKKLIYISLLLLLITGCGDKVAGPVSAQGDNVPSVNRTQIIRVEKGSVVEQYEYTKLFEDEMFLNITFPECNENGCGISIERSSITYWETLP